ncbi:MAG: hypothetical protein ACHREM_15795 [Polyangiales bacterium]
MALRIEPIATISVRVAAMAWVTLAIGGAVTCAKPTPSIAVASAGDRPVSPSPSSSSSSSSSIVAAVTPDQLVAVVGDAIARLVAAPTKGTLAYGPIATEAKLGALRPALIADATSLEWRGNHLGDRRRRATLTECATCVGFAIDGIDLLDGHVARFDASVKLDVVATRADDACAIARDALAAIVDVHVGDCACDGVALTDETSVYALPGPRRPATRCNPATSAGLRFEVDRGGRATEGLFAETSSDARLTLRVQGPSWRKLLDANAAAYE